MIFVDSNIPMYLIGADHPHKTDAQQMVERLILANRRLVTSTEVFQEILHRYVYINRREAIQPAFDVLSGIIDEILPIEESDVIGAKDLACAHHDLSARDALHAAVMRRHDITQIMTFDKGFERLAGINRLALPNLPF